MKHKNEEFKMHTLQQNKSIITTLAITLSSLFISACGGGGETTTVSNVNPSEPVQLTSSSWSKSLAKTPEAFSIKTKISQASPGDHPQLRVDVKGAPKTAHWQLHIDSDNNPNTGFQHDNEAWSKLSGIDYIVEDGYLYKSTANDSSWSWEYVAKPDKATLNTISLRLDDHNGAKGSIYGICKKFNIGFVGLDDNWSIQLFYPNANKMLEKTTRYCKKPPENTTPVITLKGLSRMVVELNSAFTDPGATAYDKEDGDLTADIKRVQGVYIDTSKLGGQAIRYYVTDSQGRVGYASRSVHVVKKAAIIKIDGNADDWTIVDTYAQSGYGTMKVNDDKENVYIMIDSRDSNENWQVFINSVGDGMTMSGYGPMLGGSDFLIENSDFAKFSGKNNEQWAWNFDVPQVATIAKNGNFIEMMIPKHTLNPGSRSSGVRLGFNSMNSDWKDLFFLGNKYYTYRPTEQ